MTLANIYIGRGGEDMEWAALGGAVLVTTGGHYRSGKARCSMKTTGQIEAWRNKTAFSAGSFWFGCYLYINFNTYSGNFRFITFADATGVERLYLTTNGSQSTWRVFKRDAAGTATQLGSDFTLVLPSSGFWSQKFDMRVVYATVGEVTIYSGGVPVFTYSGDTTTNSATALAFVTLSSMSTSGNASYEWSEALCLDVDTRGLSLVTWGPVANGNTHDWDTGTPAAANVNEVATDDTTLDGSTTAGQKDQYTTGAVPAGTTSVLAYGVGVRAVAGASGPAQLDLGLRLSGTDYWSADIPIQTGAFGTYYNDWLTNPATGVAFLPTEIGAASGFNIGAKSVT